jgi:hypothetical protein
MVWSISQNRCISKVKLENSIISIGFHPEGNLIAVASGTKLELWDWTKSLKSTWTGYNLAPNTTAPPITHGRNIRAVLFHPNGDYLLAAAPDAPRQNSETVTYCGLFAINVANWLQLNSETRLQEDEHGLLKLTNHTLILPQIHLYSDGGIDITKDGYHLITCSRLFFPPSDPINSNRANTKIGLSPLSTTERMEEDEEMNASLTLNSSAPTNLDFSQPNYSCPAKFPLGVKNNGSSAPKNSYILQPSYSRPAKFPLVVKNNDTPFQLQFFEGPLGSLGQAAAHANGNFSFSSDRADLQVKHDENSVERINQQLSLNNLIRSSFPSSSLQQTVSIGIPVRGSLESFYSTKRMISRITHCDWQSEFRNECLMNASLFMYDAQGNKLDHNFVPLPQGWRSDDHLCIFKLQFREPAKKEESSDESNAAPEFLPLQVVNAKPLVGVLMRSITSVKWSPANRYVLLGYGVRSDGRVQDHSHSYVPWN